jgi:hypothetical protein
MAARPLENQGVDGRVKHGHDEVGGWSGHGKCWCVKWALAVPQPIAQHKKSFLRRFFEKKRLLA